MDKYCKKLPLTAGILFLLTAVISVAAAWSAGLHRWDMGISFSAYVGLRRTTSVLYFIAAVLMIALLAVYIVKMQMHLSKRIIYAVILLCILGTAFFPYNFYSEAPTATTIDLHNDFAIALMLATTVSFVLTAVRPESSRRGRVAAWCSIAYAAAFIVLYFIGFEPLFRTFFIWENLFIVLLLIGFHMEQYRIAPEGSTP